MVKAVKPFQFKQFAVEQDQCAMKVGTDGVLLGAWANAAGADRILDVGTGTGVIAIMMAQRNPEAMVHGVEIEAQACEQAAGNMQRSPFAERLEAIESSIQDYAKTCRVEYDLIVSNPPFFSGGTFSANQNRNDVRHTVKLPNGDLLQAARRLLSKDGKLAVILPYIEGLRFQELATRYHLYCTKMTEVLPTKSKPVERLLLQFEQEANTMKSDSLVIQAGGRNEFTEEYIALTKDFYLNM
ncbi:MAG: methyltransferase [Bacteroidota bacterium]